MARDKFKECVENNLVIYKNEICPYEFRIDAYNDDEEIIIMIKSKEENLPHLLGLQEIAPYLKGVQGIKAIEKEKISKARLYTSVSNHLKVKQILDKNNYFLYVPALLSYAKPIYLYKNKNTDKFDCDYLMVKKVKILKKNVEMIAYVHVGIKETDIANTFVLNSVLVTFHGEPDYNIYYNGQPYFTIKKITKTNLDITNSEITYLERNEINLSIETIAATLTTDTPHVTSKLVKNIERINRKLNTKITIEEINDLYNKKDNIIDPRFKNLIKETYKLLNT